MREGLICALLLLLITLLILYVKPPYVESELIKRLKRKISQVNTAFGTYDIREDSDGSYTENKRTIYVCTKDPETGQIYSDNTLIYVILHECAHMLDSTYNEAHDDKFKKIFLKLLQKAERTGIYNPAIPIPNTYCGLKN